MNKNFIEYYTLQKGNNDLYSNIKINSNRRQTDTEEDKTKIQKKKISQNNSNKRFHTPLSIRYQTQPYDKIINNNNTIISHIPIDLSPKNNYSQNQQQYQYKAQNEKDNDVSYYKNLYIQTKNNLNKEKQKNEENQKNLIMMTNLTKENKLLKEKINSLTTQLDRVIDLVEKSNNQNIQNMNIKQEEIN